MLTLILLLIVVGAALTAFLYVGAVYIQGYFYTEPGGELGWRAPAAAAAIAVFYLLWCFLDVRTKGLNAQDIPFDTLFNFNPTVDMFTDPVDKLWVIKKNNPKPIEYVRKKYVQAGRTFVEYKQKDTDDTWPRSGVEAVVIKNKDEEIRFERRPGVSGKYPEFVSPSGWVMAETEEGPSGMPHMTRTGRLLANLALNLLHLGVWFVCLWLLLRFQWAHALSLAAVLWLLATLTVLPALLGRAAAAAWQQSPQAGAPAAGERGARFQRA